MFGGVFVANAAVVCRGGGIEILGGACDAARYYRCVSIAGGELAEGACLAGGRGRSVRGLCRDWEGGRGLIPTEYVGRVIQRNLGLQYILHSNRVKFLKLLDRLNLILISLLIRFSLGK